MKICLHSLCDCMLRQVSNVLLLSSKTWCLNWKNPGVGELQNEYETPLLLKLLHRCDVSSGADLYLYSSAALVDWMCRMSLAVCLWSHDGAQRSSPLHNVTDVTWQKAPHRSFPYTAYTCTYSTHVQLSVRNFTTASPQPCSRFKSRLITIKNINTITFKTGF